MVTLYKGQDPLTKDDLNVFILDENGDLFDPFSITYTIYHSVSNSFDLSCSEEMLLETLNSVPVPFGIGEFFAPWQMPQDIDVGNYRIKWDVKKFIDSPIISEVEEINIILPVDKLRQATLTGGDNVGSLPGDQFQGGCAEGDG
jgi:hypothetical protein